MYRLNGLGARVFPNGKKKKTDRGRGGLRKQEREGGKRKRSEFRRAPPSCAMGEGSGPVCVCRTGFRWARRSIARDMLDVRVVTRQFNCLRGTNGVKDYAINRTSMSSRNRTPARLATMMIIHSFIHSKKLRGCSYEAQRTDKHDLIESPFSSFF